MSKSIRCAIYTRKSTDEGLDQDFNSLDAQREACEAYIQSQRGLGWVVLKKQYDDGGISGGTMERPALQEILKDIENRKIDLIVVYKVDRLTRSLMDFSKIIETFDNQEVSFGSVTQKFNTANSMGRLTLNVLLSFAQFEREVTAERIRDKIAASKKKGMWMGGVVPLGYDTHNKKLKINNMEAETVRTLFQLYIKLKSVYAIKIEADRLGLVTKRRQTGKGPTGGIAFSRGHLYQLLRNPLYVGDVSHKGKIYPGLHEAILARDTWNTVQEFLTLNAVKRYFPTNTRQMNLFTGLIFDSDGKTISPAYTSKKGRRYRYYVSKNLVPKSNEIKDGWRLPAKTLEGTVIKAILDIIGDEARLVKELGIQDTGTIQIKRSLDAASKTVSQIKNGDKLSLHTTIQNLITRIVLNSDRISIQINASPFRETSGPIKIEVPMEMRRRGIESKIILSPNNTSSPDEKLINLIADTQHWFEQLTSGIAISVREIANHNGIDESDVSRFLPLAFLAPKIVEIILAGKQPPELTVEKLKRIKSLPVSWKEQYQKLGITR